MNYILIIPSLEHMALAKITITLWDWDDAQVYIKQPRGVLKCFCEMKAELIKEKSCRLPLPKKLKEKVLSFILPVGFQIALWVDFHMLENKFVTELPDTFFWTPMGTIDKKKTAEVMIKKGNLSIDKRFDLACIYCLEEEIHNLWKIKLYKYCCVPQGSAASRLISFWYQNLNEEATKTYSTSYAFAFSLSAEIGNETATRYFFKKLDSESKSDIVMKAAKCVASIVKNHSYIDIHRNDHFSSILLFLLSIMNVEQRKDIFTNHIYEVLKSLLIWPWNGLFLEMVNKTWEFLSYEDYSEILITISRSMYYKDNHFKLFEAFWHHSPQTYKLIFINSNFFHFLICSLCTCKGYDKNVEFILKDANISVRKNLNFSKIGHSTLETLVFEDRFIVIKHIFPECISPQEELLEIKDHLMKYLPTSDNKIEF